MGSTSRLSLFFHGTRAYRKSRQAAWTCVYDAAHAPSFDAYTVKRGLKLSSELAHFFCDLVEFVLHESLWTCLEIGGMPGFRFPFSLRKPNDI